jgi:hypothetical protein
MASADMEEFDGWLFSSDFYRVWIYLDDVAEATKIATKHLPGPPTGEAARISGGVFRDFFKVKPGGFVTGKVFEDASGDEASSAIT